MIANLADAMCEIGRLADRLDDCSARNAADADEIERLTDEGGIMREALKAIIDVPDDLGAPEKMEDLANNALAAVQTRLKCIEETPELTKAIVPQVAEVIFRAIDAAQTVREPK